MLFRVAKLDCVEQTNLFRARRAIYW